MIRVYIGGRPCALVAAEVETFARALFWLGLGVDQLPTVQWLERSGFMS